MFFEALAFLGLSATLCYGQPPPDGVSNTTTTVLGSGYTTSTSSSTSSLLGSYTSSSATQSLTTTSVVSTVVTVSASGTAPAGYTITTYSFAATPVGPGTASSNSTSSAPTSISSNTSSSTTSQSNATCSGTTLNVLGASLDWWYTSTVYDPVSTFTAGYDANASTYTWSVIPQVTSFDISTALTTGLECTSTKTFLTAYNATYWDVSCFAQSTPVAAATTVITQTAYRSLNATTGTGQPPNAVKTPPPAAITIPASGGNYSAGTPFVYFSAYEIMTKSETTYGNGSTGCAEVTHAYNMSSPFSFEYEGGNVEGEKEVNAGVTGDVAPAFLGVVNASNAVAGSWVAAPTVAIVVQKVFAVRAQRFAETATLETPSATLPPGLTQGVPTTTGQWISPVSTNGEIASSQNSLQVPTTKPTPTLPPTLPPTSPAAEHTSGGGGGTPQTTAPFTGFHGTSKVTVEVGVSSGETVVTAVFSGGTITATRVPETQEGGGTTQGGGSGPGGPGGVISAIKSALSPTNALGVLSEAQDTFPVSNPTAKAILHGISPTTAPGSGPGGSPAASIPLITVAGHTFTANAATQFSLAPGATLTPGGTAVFHGTTVSLAPSATAVVINGHTQIFSPPPSITQAPSITVGGIAYGPTSGSTYMIDGQSLTPGGVITVSGTTISLAPGLSNVVINGHTEMLSAAAMITEAPALTIGGTVFSPISGSTYDIDGSMLTPGGVITVSGTTISLGLSASDIVVNGLTQSLAPGSVVPAAATADAITNAPVLTIGGETFTAINSGTTYNIDGEILTPGEEETVTVDGKTYIISLDSAATELVIETEGPNGQVTATSTETLFPVQGDAGATTTTDVGGATATAGSRSSAGASQTVSMQTGGSPPGVGAHICGVGIAFGSLLLAVWL